MGIMQEDYLLVLLGIYMVMLKVLLWQIKSLLQSILWHLPENETHPEVLVEDESRSERNEDPRPFVQLRPLLERTH